MIKHKRASSSSLFLMELILAILLFCIASSICVSSFARSHVLHKNSYELNNAVNIVQNAAEVIHSDSNLDNINANLNSYFSDSFELSKGNCIIGYSKSFEPTEDIENAPYVLRVCPKVTNNLLSCDIIFTKQGENPTDIYQLYVEQGLY